ncbi:unnamed protein product, partial [Mesorhabditis spiculigera]
MSKPTGFLVRKASERGHANHGWLDTRHTFSFSDYHDPKWMQFSALRVINEDFIAPKRGFGSHPHRDMEILTYVLQGSVEHQDSMGNAYQIPAPEFQLMSAGTGIVHSEKNPDPQVLHLYQIWIRPERTGITPRYEQRRFESVPGKQLILSPDAAENSLKVYQDMRLYRWNLNAGSTERIELKKNRWYWLQIVKGRVTIDETLKLETSDAVGMKEQDLINVSAEADTEILLFDLPPE